jgi:hypothetical protein
MHKLARELLTAPDAATREGDIPGLGLVELCRPLGHLCCE